MHQNCHLGNNIVSTYYSKKSVRFYDILEQQFIVFIRSL